MIKIEAGQGNDSDAINAVELAAGALFGGTHMDWAVGEVTPAAKLIAGAQSENLWVAKDDDAIVGFILTEQCGAELHICEMSVSPDWQGQGIASALLDTVLAAAAHRGFVAVTLTTDRTLAWNAPFYARRGFVTLDEATVSPRLAALLASETNPHFRCAMLHAITP